MLRFLLRLLQQVTSVCYVSCSRFVQRRSIEEKPSGDQPSGDQSSGDQSSRDQSSGDHENSFEFPRMGFEPVDSGPMSLAEALLQAEKAAGVTNQAPDLDAVLVLAKAEADHPSVGEVWRNFESRNRPEDPLFPSRRLASLVLETSVQPEAVGHALVLACRAGHIRCVRRLREIQKDQLCGSMLVGLFNAFALLKAAEAGHAEVVEELLQPMVSASTALMGYMMATRWKDTEGTAAYPYVEQPRNPPSQDWMRKVAACKSTLPPGGPIFQSGGWDLRGLPGLHENLHELVRASYRTYLLWRASVVAASQCHTEVFRVLLQRRTMDNAALSKSLGSMETLNSGGKKGDVEAKKLIADRAKLDTLLYQLVEEYSTKNYHDAMLYTLWGHIQRGGRDHPSGHGAGKPRCVAQAQNGVWEMQLEVPLLMMPVEYALKDEEPFRRYKQLTLLYTQRAKVNIQLLTTVEAQPNFLQVTVAVKHVRFKAENSKWDESHMGHFPTVVTLSVMPQAKDGSSVTMTNSSSNTSYKIGKGENISAGSGVGEGATRGVGAALRASAGLSVTNTMKQTPWRFEQLPLKDDRGGSFVWTLQSMKGLPFDRSNPHRMAESASHWKWGRRVPGNPLDQLPFSSEGGIIFTGNEYTDTMMWRFPKTMEGKKLRWSIEGQIHSTFTTSRYFETRIANFCGDIEEKLIPLEDKKDKDKDKGGEKSEKSEKKDKDKNKDGEKSEKKDKDKNKDGEKSEKSEKKDKDKNKDGEKSEKSEKKDKDKNKDGEKSEKKDKDKNKDGEKSEKSEKDKDKNKDGEKSEKGDKSEKEGKDDKKTLAHLDTTLRTEFEEWLEFKKYKEEQQRANKSGESQAQIVETVASNELMQSIPEAPESFDASPSVSFDDEQQGMKKKPMNLKLDLDNGQASLADRPSLQRANGYNGRWLGTSDMEPLSPPVRPFLGIGDEDLYTFPDSAYPRATRSAGRDGEQRIKGLSVRSVRTRMDSSDSHSQRER